MKPGQLCLTHLKVYAKGQNCPLCWQDGQIEEAVDMIRKNSPLDEEEASSIFAKILEGTSPTGHQEN